MSDVVISVENLGKRYTIGHERPKDNLRDQITHTVSRWFRRGSAGIPVREDFWALKEVSFEVRHGEVLGIIGRNGAGKSTLLKILSRITEPTTGRVRIRGRVASLLEVGTGFHPELTGRENVFLNGAILGMSRAEITRKFDEIVAFAEVERFIDTPVKHYSSGMYVRLAFAVAAHLDPEILIIDEVLAVGDTQFQQKCLGKMEEVASGAGRTVLFVSHNLAAVRQLCRSGLLLSNGRLECSGPVSSVLERYQALLPVQASYSRTAQAHTPEAVITKVSLLDIRGHLLEHFSFGDTITISIQVDVRTALPPVQLAVRVSTFDGIAVLTTTNIDETGVLATIPIGYHDFRVTLPPWLASGLYVLKVALCEPQRRIFDAVDDEVRFEITKLGNSTAGLHDDRKGVTAPLLKWQRHPMP